MVSLLSARQRQRAIENHLIGQDIVHAERIDGRVSAGYLG